MVPIKLNSIGDIILEFTGMDAINEPNANHKTMYNDTQHDFFIILWVISFHPQLQH
jgi:hypothetical protein